MHVCWTYYAYMKLYLYVHVSASMFAHLYVRIFSPASMRARACARVQKCAEEEFVQRILKGYEVFTGTCGRHAHTQVH